MNSKVPKPHQNENPTAYADRLGQLYAATVPLEYKKRYGQYLTPAPIAVHMARLFDTQGSVIRLLDPGAGSGVLTCAVGEHLASGRRKPARLVASAYEADIYLAAVLTAVLEYLKEWLAARGISLEILVMADDFVMANSGALAGTFGTNEGLFALSEQTARFDLVIANPPYFKIPKSDPRARAARTVIHGQPNIYALFMATAAAVLEIGGQFVFITPRSFASGPYFRLFRERFFGIMEPESIHVFESRTRAFQRDEVLQENIILKARRKDGWVARPEHRYISICSSNGLADLDHSTCKTVQQELALDMSSFDKVLNLPSTDEDLTIMEKVRAWSGSLKSYGLEISTGPVVPFRALTLLDQEGHVPQKHSPLLWMQHVKTMQVQWPIAENRKPQYIKNSKEAMKLLVPNRNYVLIRRFSAKEEKRRLVAAPYFKGQFESAWVGLENHLNYIHRPGGELSEDEAVGLSVLYNSSALNTYFRALNGSTQVSATELRTMPLPDRDLILWLGAKAKAMADPIDQIDALVDEVLEKEARSTAKEVSHVAEMIRAGGVRGVAASG